MSGDNLTFPYPTTGIPRKKGQGCASCVHTKYCQAFYWYYRYAQFPTTTGKNVDTIDEHLGISCNSWSDNENDRLDPISDGDKAYNERLAETEKILIEPFENGMTDPTTGNALRREI